MNKLHEFLHSCNHPPVPSNFLHCTSFGIPAAQSFEASTRNYVQTVKHVQYDRTSSTGILLNVVNMVGHLQWAYY